MAKGIQNFIKRVRDKDAIVEGLMNALEAANKRIGQLEHTVTLLIQDQNAPAEEPEEELEEDSEKRSEEGGPRLR